MSTVRIVKKRNRDFYKSIWKTFSVPVLVLFTKYCNENADHRVSIGLFLNLRSFYCKLHLLGHWCILCAKKLEIILSVTDYKSFFDVLYADCGDAIDTYIQWEYTPDKKQVCANNCDQLACALDTADPSVTVPFTHFEKQITYDAKGKMVLNKSA